MACDKLVILHRVHIGSLCVSNHTNAGPEIAKVGALFASAGTSKKTNAPSEGVSGGYSDPTDYANQIPIAEIGGQIPKFVL